MTSVSASIFIDNTIYVFVLKHNSCTRFYLKYTSNWMLVLQEKTAVLSILHSLKRVITCGRNTGQHYNNDVELVVETSSRFYL